MTSPSMEAFAESLPKVELHAHINGCVRDKTLRELSTDEPVALLGGATRTLSQCFALFSLIHKILTDCAHIRRITREAIEDFARENVCYLELRTTPKNRPERQITKSSYMQAVLNGRDDFYQQNPKSSIHVRFILSIDRRESGAQAMETVELAYQLKSSGVVGIDLSGDPHLRTFTDWQAAMECARSKGLKLTFHAGEIIDDDETARLLRFHPDRVGHMCFASESLRNEHFASRIPLEICITSNLITKSVHQLSDHHVVQYYQRQHPIVICTDDPGPFATTLTKEYLLLTKILQLDKKGLFDVASKSIDYCFCDEETKKQIMAIFTTFKIEHFADLTES